MNRRVRTAANEPTPAAVYERARRLANIAVWAVRLQHRRLRTSEPEDGEFLFRRFYDFQFFIMALTRCRLAAVLATQVPSIEVEIRQALKDFDEVLPGLKTMRDTGEHIDEYALDRGRNDKPTRQALEVSTVGPGEIDWLGARLNADDGLDAAQRLFNALRSVAPKVDNG